MASEKMKVRIALLSAFITLASFLYKFALGIVGASMVLIIASISTLMVFVCKILYAKNFTKNRESKKKAYFFMMIAAASYVAIFIIFAVLKVGGIDITRQVNYEGWLYILFIVFLLIMFLLSVFNLKGALQKDDIIVIGIKEMTFISALTDVAIVFEFITRIVVYYVPVNIPGLVTTNRFMPIIVSALMIVVVVSMIKRHLSYKA